METFTVKQFCDKFNIGRNKFYDEVKSGRLTLRKVGAKKVLVSKEDADKWLRSLPPVTSGAAA